MRMWFVAAVLAAVFAIATPASEPVAVAEKVSPAVVVAGDVVTLTGRSSSAVNPTYIWTQVSGPAVAVTGAAGCEAAVTCSSPGDYGFELTVVDAGGSSSDTVRFAVVAPLVDYTIASSSTGHGTVSPSGTNAYPAGSFQTFLFVADAGYDVSQVLVDGFDEGRPNSYFFPNLSADHTVVVSFASNGTVPPPSDDGGGHHGGGGGCSLAVGHSSDLGWMLPYAAMLAWWAVGRRKA